MKEFQFNLPDITNVPGDIMMQELFNSCVEYTPNLDKNEEFLEIKENHDLGFITNSEYMAQVIDLCVDLADGNIIFYYGNVKVCELVLPTIK